LCVESGLVWGEELYFDATKVDANASLDSIAPRFYVDEHLDELFTRDELPNPNQEDSVATGDGGGDLPVGDFYEELPSASDKVLIAENAAKDDWISRDGRQRREQRAYGTGAKRTSWPQRPIPTPLR
jgi:hypothetical protein